MKISDWKLPSMGAALASLWPRKAKAEQVDEPLGDLPYMSLVKPAPASSPTPEKPAKADSQAGVGDAPIDYRVVVDDATKEKQKTAKEHALQVMHDLPLGLVMKSTDPDKPVTTELSAADLSQYAKASKTKARIMVELAGKGVIVKRPKRSALVVEAYQYKPPTDEPIIDPLKADTINALTNGKPLKFSPAEAEKMYQHSTGDRLDDRIQSALKSKGGEVR